MSETIVNDEFIDLKLNDCIESLRKEYEKEYEIIEGFIKIFRLIEEFMEKKGNTQQNVFLLASMIQLNKLYQSAILLLERGLKEPAYVLIRTILDVIFKVIEVIRNKNYVTDLLIEQEYEMKNTLIDIKKNKLFDMISEDEVNKQIRACDKKINKRSKPNTKSYYIADKNGMKKEYILYRLQCEYTHFSTSVIGSIIKITENECLLDGNFQLENFKESVAWLISITATVFPIILNEYLKEDSLILEYKSFLEKFENNFKDLIIQ